MEKSNHSYAVRAEAVPEPPLLSKVMHRLSALNDALHSNLDRSVSAADRMRSFPPTLGKMQSVGDGQADAIGQLEVLLDRLSESVTRAGDLADHMERIA